MNASISKLFLILTIAVSTLSALFYYFVDYFFTNAGSFVDGFFSVFQIGIILGQCLLAFNAIHALVRGRKEAFSSAFYYAAFVLFQNLPLMIQTLATGCRVEFPLWLLWLQTIYSVVVALYLLAAVGHRSLMKQGGISVLASLCLCLNIGYALMITVLSIFIFG